MAELFANNATSILSTNLAVAGTTFSVRAGDGVLFPTVTPGDTFKVTLFTEAGVYEIIKVTARSTDTFTVVRAQEGTAALFWPVNSRLEMRATAGIFESIYTAITALGASTAAALVAQVSAYAASAGATLIGFIQFGTGAVLRTAESKLRERLSPEDFGGAADGVTDATAAMLATVDRSRDIDLAVGTYRMAAVQVDRPSIRGSGVATRLTANSTTSVLNLGYTNLPHQWHYRSLSDLVIDGNAKASTGVTYTAAVSPEFSGRWEIARVTFTNCSKGIYKPNGDIGNAYRCVNFNGNDYGYYALGQSVPIMHGGNDTFDNCQFSSNALAGVYIDSATNGTGGTRFTNDCIFQTNPGFGIFVYNWASSYTPLIFDGVWFEGNHTSGSVSINGTPYTPRDIYLRNCDHAILQNGIVPMIELVASRLTIVNSFMNSDVSNYTIDSTSIVTAENAKLDGGYHPVVVKSIAGCLRQSGNFAARFYAEPRVLKSHETGTVLQSISYDTANTYSFPGTGAVTATRVADGLIFDSCANVVIPTNATQLQPAVTLTTGRWYVFTCDAKHVSGVKAELSWSIADSVTLCQTLAPLMVTGEWRTIASVSRYDGVGGTVRWSMTNGPTGNNTVRMSALQIVEFTTEKDAVAFFNSRAYKTGTYPRTFYGNVAPTTGTWAVGDECINSTPVVGQPKSWKCTVAGTPGTWVSTGNL